MKKFRVLILIFSASLLFLSCQTVAKKTDAIVEKENKKLSKFIETESGYFPKVLVPTNKKYDDLGIKVYKLPFSKKGLTVDLAKKVLETQNPLKASTVLYFPKDLIIYEKRFLVN